MRGAETAVFADFTGVPLPDSNLLRFWPALGVVVDRVGYPRRLELALSDESCALTASRCSDKDDEPDRRVAGMRKGGLTQCVCDYFVRDSRAPMPSPRDFGLHSSARKEQTLAKNKPPICRRKEGKAMLATREGDRNDLGGCAEMPMRQMMATLASEE